MGPVGGAGGPDAASRAAGRAAADARIRARTAVGWPPSHPCATASGSAGVVGAGAPAGPAASARRAVDRAPARCTRGADIEM